MTVLSLHPAKILTTGEGGAVLTDRDDVADRLRRFRNHGIATELAARTDWTYAMVELGYNYRLTDIGAALGSIAARSARRCSSRGAASSPPGISNGSAGHPHLDIPVGRAGADPAWHFCFAQLRLDRCASIAAAVYRALRAEGIGVNVHYIPVHRHPVLPGALSRACASRSPRPPTSGCSRSRSTRG